MKKLIASAVVAAAVALPAAPATAADAAWWGRKPCDWGEMGTIIWHDTPATDYEEVNLCFPRVGPGAPRSEGVAMVGTKRCPAPYVGGTIVWHDTPVTDYEEIWLCIPGTP